jgi:hypothetical protein
LWSGQGHNLLWACNVAAPLLALGCALGIRRLIAIPTLWLCFGTPLWLLDLATGGTMTPTSPLVHLLCPVVGILAARRLGWGAPSWHWATAALGVLLLLTRLVSPPALNVNLAFAVWAGWERYFPSHGLYIALLLISSAATFWLVERLLSSPLVDGPPSEK